MLQKTDGGKSPMNNPEMEATLGTRQTKQKPQETKKTQICLLQVKGMAFNYTLQFIYLHSVLKSKEQEKSVGCRINFFFSNFR
jgi:hypothetical protein